MAGLVRSGHVAGFVLHEHPTTRSDRCRQRGSVDERCDAETGAGDFGYPRVGEVYRVDRLRVRPAMRVHEFPPSEARCVAHERIRIASHLCGGTIERALALDQEHMMTITVFVRTTPRQRCGHGDYFMASRAPQEAHGRRPSISRRRRGR